MLHRRLLVLTTLGAAALLGPACSHSPPPPANEPAPPAALPAEAAPPAAQPDPLAAGDEAAKVISADLLRDHITKVASDEFEGRGPTTRGDQKMRGYLVDQLKAMGYEPGGENGAWEQPVELVGTKAAMPPTWTFTKGGKSFNAKWYDQYIAGSGVQSEKGAIKNAEVVFVG